MEMPAQVRLDGLDTVDASDVKSISRDLYHRRHHRNSLVSPLLRLPTELVIKILEHATERDDRGDDSDGGTDSTSAAHRWRVIGQCC